MKLTDGKHLASAWCRDNAQLLHQTYGVPIGPLFHNFAISEAVDVYPLYHILSRLRIGLRIDGTLRQKMPVDKGEHQTILFVAPKRSFYIDE